MNALPFALIAALSAVQAPAPRPVTLVSEVRAAIAAHDLARADMLVAQRRADQGNTPEVIEPSVTRPTRRSSRSPRSVRGGWTTIRTLRRL
jgi:hypothetical protein